jgi:hypothetical protein
MAEIPSDRQNNNRQKNYFTGGKSLKPGFSFLFSSKMSLGRKSKLFDYLL